MLAPLSFGIGVTNEETKKGSRDPYDRTTKRPNVETLKGRPRGSWAVGWRQAPSDRGGEHQQIAAALDPQPPRPARLQ
jgi:hypothetical protein